MRTLFSSFAKDETGANALEYALVLILVAFAIVGGAGALGTNINTLFQNTANNVNITPPPL